MSYVIGLRCRECGTQYPQKGVHVCDLCFGPLEVEYDYAAMQGKVTRESIEAGAAESVAVPRFAALRRAAGGAEFRLDAVEAGAESGEGAGGEGVVYQG